MTASKLLQTERITYMATPFKMFKRYLKRRWFIRTNIFFWLFCKIRSFPLTKHFVLVNHNSKWHEKKYSYRGSDWVHCNTRPKWSPGRLACIISKLKQPKLCTLKSFVDKCYKNQFLTGSQKLLLCKQISGKLDYFQGILK